MSNTPEIRVPAGFDISSIYTVGADEPSIIRIKHFQVPERFMDCWIEADKVTFSEFFNKKAGFMGKIVNVGVNVLTEGFGSPCGVPQDGRTRWIIIIETWKNALNLALGNVGGAALVQQFNEAFMELCNTNINPDFNKGPQDFIRLNEFSNVRYQGASGLSTEVLSSNSTKFSKSSNTTCPPNDGLPLDSGFDIAAIYSTGKFAPSYIRYKYFQVPNDEIENWAWADKLTFTCHFNKQPGFLGKQVYRGLRLFDGTVVAPGTIGTDGSRWVVVAEYWRNERDFRAANAGIQEINDLFVSVYRVLSGGMDPLPYVCGAIDVNRLNNASSIRYEGALGQ